MIIIITIVIVFKWLSKVITWLRMLRLVIGLKESRQFFNQWEAKPKSIAPCTRHFSRALSELKVIARNCDWFIALFAPVVIARSNCFQVLVFRQSFENRSIHHRYRFHSHESLSWLAVIRRLREALLGVPALWYLYQAWNVHNNYLHNIYFVLKDLKGSPGSRGLPGKRVSALQAELVLSTSLFRRLHWHEFGMLLLGRGGKARRNWPSWRNWLWCKLGITFLGLISSRWYKLT